VYGRGLALLFCCPKTVFVTVTSPASTGFFNTSKDLCATSHYFPHRGGKSLKASQRASLRTSQRCPSSGPEIERATREARVCQRQATHPRDSGTLAPFIVTDATSSILQHPREPTPLPFLYMTTRLIRTILRAPKAQRGPQSLVRTTPVEYLRDTSNKHVASSTATALARCSLERLHLIATLCQMPRALHASVSAGHVQPSWL
jgi:hypothetical protein